MESEFWKKMQITHKTSHALFEFTGFRQEISDCLVLSCSISGQGKLNSLSD